MTATLRYLFDRIVCTFTERTADILRDRTVIVTVSNSSIGYEASLEFVKRGIRLQNPPLITIESQLNRPDRTILIDNLDPQTGTRNVQNTPKSQTTLSEKKYLNTTKGISAIFFFYFRGTIV